jgi:hypothetical protein
MPVTIGNLTSNVNLIDSNAVMNDEMMERIIRATLARQKEETYAQEQLRQEQMVRDRVSTSAPG